MAKKSVKSRILFGGIMIVILGGLFTLDIWFFQRVIGKMSAHVPVSELEKWLGNGAIVALLAGMLSVLGVLEVIHLGRQTGAGPLAGLMVVGSAILTLQPYLAPLWPQIGQAELIGIFFFLFVLGQMYRRETRGAGTTLAWSIFGILYIGFFLSFIVSIRVHFSPGPLILLIAATKLSDIGAYSTGMLFGKHKLIPWLSPGKTWEGLVGAVIFSIAATVLLSRLDIITYGSVLGRMNLVHLILLGAGFALVGHVGDLAESLLKRDAQVKDSAHLLPEFGGVLDLIDSVLPTGLMLYLILSHG
jgi:phosphatidate cytidylyltransferase